MSWRCELAERIGQSEIQLGALAGWDSVRSASGEFEEATRLCNELEPSRATTMPDWFQGRELVEALRYPARDPGRTGRRVPQLFADAARRCRYARIRMRSRFCTAEFGATLRESAPDAVDEAIRRYAGRPEVVGKPQVTATVRCIDA